jgi:hypothetical protein
MLSRSLLMRIAVLWTAAIAIGSFLPIEVKEAIGTETRSSLPAVRHRAAISHRVGHLIAFGVASLLFAAASIKKTHRLYYLLFIVGLGSTIEYMQHVIFGSLFERWDIRDDALAAAVSCLLGSLLASRSHMNQAATVRETVFNK